MPHILPRLAMHINGRLNRVDTRGKNAKGSVFVLNCKAPIWQVNTKRSHSIRPLWEITVVLEFKCLSEETATCGLNTLHGRREASKRKRPLQFIEININFLLFLECTITQDSSIQIILLR